MYKNEKRYAVKAILAATTLALMLISGAAAVFAADTYVTLDNVNLRSQPSTESEVLSLLPPGTKVEVSEYNADSWSSVNYGGKSGYIKSEFIGAAAQAQTAQETAFYTIGNVNLRALATTDSEILMLVEFGTEINVTRYSPDGWSMVTCDGKKGYMNSEFIGTKAELEAAKAAMRPSVELTPWSEASGVFTIGVSAKVYDVYTGSVYYVRSFSNGNHADVEPVTTDDTAIMKQTFGGVWSWDVRPVWVTINGRTMAASINGMPHGGGVNSSNGMDGQICIHFKGSSTHNGNASFTQLHQQKAQEAYNLSI